MATPESKVKAKVKKLLAEYEPDIWFNMPVPSGWGESTLDFIGMCRGAFFVIETKADKKHPTKLQERMMREIVAKGGTAFTIGSNGGVDDPAFDDLNDWIVTTIARDDRRAA